MELTPDEIARHYSATMDSVNLLKREKPEFMSDSDWQDTIRRNKEHIKIMLERPFWTDAQDLAPFRDALK